MKWALKYLNTQMIVTIVIDGRQSLSYVRNYIKIKYHFTSESCKT